jgi:hypothetical protein
MTPKTEGKFGITFGGGGGGFSITTVGLRSREKRKRSAVRHGVNEGRLRAQML